jgi:hypothetical protein
MIEKPTWFTSNWALVEGPDTEDEEVHRGVMAMFGGASRIIRLRN